MRLSYPTWRMWRDGVYVGRMHGNMALRYELGWPWNDPLPKGGAKRDRLGRLLVWLKD